MFYIDKGNSAFRQSRNSEYIDKSGLIAVVNRTLFTRQKFTCVTRNRRFGKSMATKMLVPTEDGDRELRFSPTRPADRNSRQFAICILQSGCQ